MILNDYKPRYSERLSITSRLFKQIAKYRPAFFIFVVLTLILGGESIADNLANWLLINGEK
tara:strand:+ start:456 stop:638 length:183 start_codon:yes stop_codon:yes gene_type:complete